jgi:hypothetical protein
VVVTIEEIEMKSIENEMKAEQGIPEKEPETIGDALKKYYEEQLTNAVDANVRVLSKRQAELENILVQHCFSFN